MIRGALVVAMLALASAPARAGIQSTSFLTTFGDPAGYIESAGGFLDGVGRLSITIGGSSFGCTGALLSGGAHVLTAAHCVTASNGTLASAGSIRFDGDDGTEIIPIAEFAPHPQWDGDVLRGNDIAVLTLALTASDDIERYSIFTGSDEVGSVGEKVGFGRSGNGNDGSVLGFGTKRSGENRYDAIADVMLLAVGFQPNTNFVPGSVLQYDFDNGEGAQDSFDVFLGLPPDLGQGATEVMAAPGDSGGPTFIDGLIAGVTSYGLRLIDNDPTFDQGEGDIDSFLNSSFGEFGGDTRVSIHQAFVESFLPAVPIPPTLPLLGAALLWPLIARWRRRSPPIPG